MHYSGRLRVIRGDRDCTGNTLVTASKVLSYLGWPRASFYTSVYLSIYLYTQFPLNFLVLIVTKTYRSRH